ncbi:MAG: HlyD family efflux transporter periplasmic adaptor subunit [Bacteroidales bacterium]|jgi:HlyD family secretion protein|nr:HlyD family efflux transporter periplasmic adaptor subunit [Bacteroidales bacterium]
MKRYFITGLVFSLLLLSSCNNGIEQDATGTFEATEIIISSETAGKLTQFVVEEGSLLQAGVEIGCVDTVQLYLKKKQLQASFQAVLSRKPDIAKQIAAVREQITTQKRELNRFEILVKNNAATQKQVDDIRSSIAVLEKQQEAQLSALKSSDRSLSDESEAVAIQIEQLDDQLMKSHISSPIDGTVLVKYAEPNELVTMGKPLFKIADLSEMTLRAYITNAQLNQIRLGQKVKVFTDSGKDAYKENEGVIYWISSQAEFTPKTIQTKDERENLVYAIKIRVKNDGLIKIGMYGEVKF